MNHVPVTLTGQVRDENVLEPHQPQHSEKARGRMLWTGHIHTHTLTHTHTRQLRASNQTNLDVLVCVWKLEYSMCGKQQNHSSAKLITC